MKKTIVLLLLILFTVPSLSFANTAFDLTALEQAAYSGGRYISVPADNYGTVPLKLLTPGTATANVVSPLVTSVARPTGMALARKSIAVVGSKLPYVGLAVTGYMLYNDLRGIVSDNPSAYPNLVNSLYRPDLPLVPSVGSYVTAANGDIYQVATIYSTTGFSSDMSMQSDASSTGWQVVIYGPYAYNGNYGYSGYTWTRYYGATTGLIIHPSNVPQTPLTDAEIAANFEAANMTQAKLDQLDLAMRNNAQHVQIDNAAEIATALQTANMEKAIEAKGRELAALQDLVDSLNTQYTNYPTAENLQKLTQAIANLEKAKSELLNLNQQQSDREADVAPSLPADNIYDSAIEAPEKKDITSLLGQWVTSSPLAGMVSSFVMTVDNPVCSVSCGEVYGKELSISLCRYADTFTICGGVLLVIVHGFAVLIVIRGW